MAEVDFNSVVDSIVTAKTAGQKAAATRLRNKYLDQKARAGKDRMWVDAGIKARVTRRINEAARTRTSNRPSRRTKARV